MVRRSIPFDPDSHPKSGGGLPLFDQTRISGSDYSPEIDRPRLIGQIQRVYEAMSDGQWRTLREISDKTGDGEASISAQLRNLRKPPHRLTIDKQRRGDPKSGLWEYRINEEAA